MTVEAIVGIAVGVLALLAAVWRIIKAGHRWANVGERLVTEVADMKATLNNGIRTDIREAKERSERAAILSADAARTASVMQQQQEETTRAVNALRGEVDIYTNVVLSDRARIRSRLREAGIDLDDEEGT